jgi:mannose-6-phosphate isomerase-like protein (cupin superfamily)
MSLNFKSDTPKELIFEHVAEYLHLKNLKINKYDNTRPWGGFFVIEEAEAEKFIDLYFPGFTKEALNISGKLSPKILIVAPEKRLSWQYHNRRAEIWKLISGTAAVVNSDTDDHSAKARRKA